VSVDSQANIFQLFRMQSAVIDPRGEQAATLRHDNRPTIPSPGSADGDLTLGESTEGIRLFRFRAWAQDSFQEWASDSPGNR